MSDVHRPEPEEQCLGPAYWGQVYDEDPIRIRVLQTNTKLPWSGSAVEGDYVLGYGDVMLVDVIDEKVVVLSPPVKRRIGYVMEEDGVPVVRDREYPEDYFYICRYSTPSPWDNSPEGRWLEGRRVEYAIVSEYYCCTQHILYRRNIRRVSPEEKERRRDGQLKTDKDGEFYCQQYGGSQCYPVLPFIMMEDHDLDWVLFLIVFREGDTSGKEWAEIVRIL